MPDIRNRRLLCTALILSTMLLPGCGKNDPNKLLHKAERDLEEFLDAWSRGQPPDKFADPNRPIQGSDPDWKAGHRLLSFLSDEAKESQDTPDHVRCQVALSLQDQKGNKWDKKVVYDVQVGEKSVIRRVSP